MSLCFLEAITEDEESEDTLRLSLRRVCSGRSGDESSIIARAERIGGSGLLVMSMTASWRGTSGELDRVAVFDTYADPDAVFVGLEKGLGPGSARRGAFLELELAESGDEVVFGVTTASQPQPGIPAATEAIASSTVARSAEVSKSCTQLKY